MKRIGCLLLSWVFIFASFTIHTIAETINSTRNIDTIVQYYDDGSYLTVSAPQLTLLKSVRSTLTTIEAEQFAKFTNSSGELEWEYTLTATFSYVYGSSVTCTDASYDYSIYDTSWKFSNGSASHSGATAYGYGTFKNKVLFITTKTINVDLSITCDVYGNLS